MCCALPVAASVSVHELLSHCMRFRGKEVCKERSFGGKKKTHVSTVGRPISFMECIVIIPPLHFTMMCSGGPCSSLAFVTWPYDILLCSTVL